MGRILPFLAVLAVGCAGRTIQSDSRSVPRRHVRIPLPDDSAHLVKHHVRTIAERDGRGIGEGHLLLAPDTYRNAYFPPEALFVRVVGIVYHTAPGIDGRVTSYVGYRDGTVQTALQAALPTVIGLGPYRARGIVHAYELARIRPERFLYSYRMHVATRDVACTIPGSFRIRYGAEGPSEMFLECIEHGDK